MNNHCWRGPRSSVTLQSSDEANWPELCRGRRSPRKNGSVTYSSEEQRPAEVVQSAAQNVEGGKLDEEFPALGQRLPKRKLSCSQSLQPVADRGQLKIGEDDGKLAKVSKKPRRTDLICIDLQKALERQRCRPDLRQCSPAKTSLRICSVNLKGGMLQREISCTKRISKLKRMILNERDLKRKMNAYNRELFELEKIRAMTRGVSEIDFDSLKITSDPKIDTDFVRNMSTMTLFGKDYRKAKSNGSPEGTPEPKAEAEVTKKLRDLLIGKSDVEHGICSRTRNSSKQKTDPVDYDIIDRTLGLRICDETGETIEELVETRKMETKTTESQIKHSNSFREYCTNMLTPALNAGVERFLSEITRFQNRLYKRDEAKGRSKRRFYSGLKEVEKHIELKKVKFVVIAPDLERSRSEGVLDESVRKLIESCKNYEVVFCFALNRRKLGYLTHKKGSGSCIGVANYSGAEVVFKDVLVELVLARNAYRRLNKEPEKMLDSTKPAEDSLLSDSITFLTRILSAN